MIYLKIQLSQTTRHGSHLLRRPIFSLQPVHLHFQLLPLRIQLIQLCFPVGLGMHPILVLRVAHRVWLHLFSKSAVLRLLVPIESLLDRVVQKRPLLARTVRHRLTDTRLRLCEVVLFGQWFITRHRRHCRHLAVIVHRRGCSKVFDALWLCRQLSLKRQIVLFSHEVTVFRLQRQHSFLILRILFSQSMSLVSQ